MEKLAQISEQAAAESTPRPMRGLRLSTAAADGAPLDFAGDPDAVLAMADALRLSFGHQFNPAFAIETSRIDPLLHQRFAVYERMLKQDPLRFLLADDAGAGKTIMTGLYVREMLSRGRLKRVLIVPPAGLVGNWRRELQTLFRMDFRIVTGADVRGSNPFRGAGSDRVIVSVDTLAGETMFEALRQAGGPAYDLVVFDEAHKLSVRERGVRVERTLRYKLAEALAVRADSGSSFGGLGWTARHLLLLTATPHMGTSLPYAWLWRLLDADAFGAVEAVRRAPQPTRDRHFLRRTKEQMVGLDGEPLYPPRECSTFTYELSEGDNGEQDLYDRTTQYLDEHYGRALDNQPAVELAKTVFQRRLASSTWALLRSFERRIEKLAQTADAIESGELTAELLHRRQALLSKRYRRDYFDDTAADEDVASDGWAEGNEAYEDAVLGAVTVVSVEELRREARQVETLAERARRLVDSGRETKFERLREVLERPEHQNEKWLIFSEHRDTVDYLVRRLEGLGYRGQTAQIHGGMDWKERDRQVEAFRRPNGARFMVATDAAGEGINLQFCRLMVNYDIPWNPARLEQRMGRIHRYGQQFEVRIVNLVAGSTREGRVLQVLLEKLEEIRDELASDKVFDVIGRLFEGESLTRFMANAVTAEGERLAVERIEEALRTSRVRRIGERDAEVYGVPKQKVTGEDLRPDVERERYLQLLPAHVRRLVERGARLLDVEIRGDLDDRFALAPARPGALDPLLQALEAYPPEARDWLTVRRPREDETGIWLHPGEPVFDALCAAIQSRCGNEALRGAIFVDPRAEEPYLLHLAELRIERKDVPGTAGVPRASGVSGASGPGTAGVSGPGTAGVSPASGPEGSPQTGSAVPPDADRRVLERRLVALQQREGAQPAQCPVEQLLSLSGTGLAPGMAPLASRAPALRAQAGAYLNTVLQDLVADLRAKREAESPDLRRRVAVGFDLRAAELASRRGKLARKGVGPGESDGDELEAVKHEQRRLSFDRQLALLRIDEEARGVLPGGFRFLLHALVVRPEDVAGLETIERFDEAVEEIAVRIAADWERQLGAQVQDVSKPVLARAAGLPDWPGFDLLSTLPGGGQRCIEVKGRSARSSVPVENNEWAQACKLGDQYWLYAVLECATPAPELFRVQNPFEKLLAHQRVKTVFDVPVGSLIEAAEAEEPKQEPARRDSAPGANQSVRPSAGARMAGRG